MRLSLLSSIFLTGIIAGSADIIFACVNAYVKNGTTPDKVLRFIASGLFGKNAFTGTSAMIALGLLLHFIVVLVFTAIFFYLYPRISWIASNKILSGIVYGVIVWCVMNLIVLPLSKTPYIPFRFENMLTGMLILITAIGLPLVYFAGKFYSQKRIANEPV